MSPYSIIFISLLFSAFFSGMEIAFVSANRLKLELDKKHGRLSSKVISIYTSKPAYYIATLLIGYYASLVVYGIKMVELLNPLLIESVSMQRIAIILIVQILISTIIVLITSELISKTLFKVSPNFTLNIFAIPLFVVYIILYPITVLTIWVSNMISKYILRVETNTMLNFTKPAFGMVDIDHLFNANESSDEDTTNGQSELKLFQNTLEFSKLKVRDCMVPRTEITAIEANSPLDQLIEKVIDTGYSKILVYEDYIDNITGYVNSKDLLKKPGSIKSIESPLSIIPESMHVNHLFRKLIREQKSIALVVDEYGGTSGIITLEDIMEEIFGEIEDEHDTPEFVERKVNENEFIFSGRIEIHYLNEKYNLEIPEDEEYDTLAGFIISHYESIPKLYTRILIGQYQIRIIKVSQTKIELVNLKFLPDIK
jgi:putative hemolysin